MKTYQLTIVRDAQDGSTDVTTTLTGEVNANAATEVAAVTQQLFEDLQDEPDATVIRVNGSMADDATEEVSTISVEVTAGAYRELMQLFSAPSA